MEPDSKPSTRRTANFKSSQQDLDKLHVQDIDLISTEVPNNSSLDESQSIETGASPSKEYLTQAILEESPYLFTSDKKSVKKKVNQDIVKIYGAKSAKDKGPLVRSSSPRFLAIKINEKKFDSDNKKISTQD